MREKTYIHICNNCKKNYEISSKDESSRQNRKAKKCFCSKKCFVAYGNRIYNCKNCKKEIISKKSVVRSFCSSSCAATHNNKYKTKGIRRSKLEIWLEQQLTILYPNLKIDYNKKDTINSELDIYIPSLKLAIELNGIFHYEPIYGKDKLNQIQNNDQNKFQKCQELGISLCIIDVSTLKYFKESNTKKYLDIVVSVISQAKACF